jgi:hypothetical protein
MSFSSNDGNNGNFPHSGRFGVVLTLRTLFESPAARALAEALRRTRQTAQVVPIEITVLDESREEFEI